MFQRKFPRRCAYTPSRNIPTLIERDGTLYHGNNSRTAQGPKILDKSLSHAIGLPHQVSNKTNIEVNVLTNATGGVNGHNTKGQNADTKDGTQVHTQAVEPKRRKRDKITAVLRKLRPCVCLVVGLAVLGEHVYELVECFA